MTKSDIPTTYRVIRVPKTSPRLPDLVAKFRTARLSALQTDPTSFASQHAIEAALPLQVWTKRFSRDSTILICVATRTDAAPADDETCLIEGEWAGFAAVRGPMSYDDFYYSPDMGLPIPESPDAEARWYVHDLYTLPAHRGHGLAKKLVNACISTAIEKTKAHPHAVTPPRNSSVEAARIRLFMNPKNTWLVAMYERFGFRAAGRVTLREGFRANALEESVPDDTESTEALRTFWHTRTGLAMEQVVRIG